MSVNKKAKVEDSAVAVGLSPEFESQLDTLQEELEKLNEEAAEKILEVEKKI